MNNEQNHKTTAMSNVQNPLEKMDLSFLATLTENSANIARCIAAIQSFECGMGASMQQLERMTGLTAKVIRGNLSDLVKKGHVTVNDMVESCYLYELKDFPR